MKDRKSMVEDALSTITGMPLEPGALIQVQMLEEVFGLERHTQAFGWLISEIRRALYQRGIYLSGEGLEQTRAYQILHPRDHQWIAKLALARCERDLEGKQVLLVNTQLDGLSQLEKTRHENTLRELSLRLSAMRRAEEFSDMLAKKKSKSKLPEPS
jgi:hypothetical protein